MEELKKYIQEILGVELRIEKLTRNKISNIPIHIHLAYNIYRTYIFNNEIILIENKNIGDFKILQTYKHIELIKNTFNIPIVLIIAELASYKRLRLIEKRINFIVPGKQLYIPALLMDLREFFMTKKETKKETLIPSAQMIVLYHLLNMKENKDFYNLSFKEIAKLMRYSSMAISKAVSNLKELGLIEVQGFKEKRFSFISSRRELWMILKEKNYFCDPVIKKVYVDEIPNHTRLLISGESALAEYSDMNPSRQDFFAIEKNVYYALKKNNELVNENKNEGLYCLEVWKYNPQILTELFGAKTDIVDPLSLYCSLMNHYDDRIQMALEQIENKYLW